MGRRQSLLAQVRARLERFGVDHDPATVLGPEAVAELTALLETVPEPAADLDIAHAAGWLHWCRYLVLEPGDNQQDLADALTFFEPAYQRRPDAVPDQVRIHFARLAASDDPQAVADRAATLLQGTDRADLDAAIDACSTPADTTTGATTQPRDRWTVMTQWPRPPVVDRPLRRRLAVRLPASVRTPSSDLVRSPQPPLPP